MSRILLLVILLFVRLAPADAQGQDPIAQAELLRNAGHYAEAAELLRSFLRQQPDDARALVMLAETLYWQGDFSAARKYFRAVLQRDPNNAAARRQLDEIQAASAPWMRLQWELLDDNQPLVRNRFDLHAAAYINPLWSIGLRINPEWIDAEDATTSLVRVEGSLGGFLPGARTELELSAGATRWHSDDNPGVSSNAAEPTGRARIGVRAGSGLTISAIAERALYTATIASLAEPLPTTSLRLMTRLERNGWLGEAALQRESYPDDNAITTTYAWLLAPIVRTTTTQLHAGYAFSFQDAASSRFVAVVPQRPGSGGTLEGRYEPYFTPERELQHGVAASLAVSAGKGARFQVNGSYGAYARRAVPVLERGVDPGPGPPNRNPVIREQFKSETFHPFNVRAAGTLPLGRQATFTLEAERLRTSFYQQTRLSAFMSLRFVRRNIS